MCTTAPSARQPSIFDSGASVGMKTSHGTPRVRAACAHAQAWLPALPAVTPRRAAVAQRGELVQRAADLERAGPLEVLGLEDDLGPGALR